MILPAEPSQLDAVRAIFREYATWVGDDICFSSFETELAALPGRYAPPTGRLLLAWHHTLRSESAGESTRPSQVGQALSPATEPNGAMPARTCEKYGLAACAALREFAPGIGEMKRLYVRPQYRGLGLGRAMTERIIEESRAAGYTLLRLDTLPKMQRAIPLYRALGFREIPRYSDNPATAICFELVISKVATAPE